MFSLAQPFAHLHCNLHTEDNEVFHLQALVISRHETLQLKLLKQNCMIILDIISCITLHMAIPALLITATLIVP